MKKYFSLVLTLFAALPAMAQAAQWDIDTAHTSVTFKVRHMVSKTQGRFTAFSGTFDYDDKKPGDSKVKVDIETKSIDTDNQKRDDHLRSADFFDVEKFPKIEFVSTKIEGASKKGAKIHGNLTIHGITKPVVLNAEFMGTSKDPWGNERFGATATTKINRKDFGLTWNKALEAGGFLIGDDVEITLEVEGIKKSPKS